MNAPYPVDAALPHLSLALDDGAMQCVFADVLRPHGVSVERCRIDRVKYRPGRNATLGYRLWLDDARGRYEQFVAARLCSGDAAARSARASRQAMNASRAGPAVRWLPMLDMLTWWWPNDAKLRAPHALSDPNVLRELVLPDLSRALDFDARDNAVDIAGLEVVQYVPEHRLTVRVDLRCSDGRGTQTLRVYAKTSREPATAVAYGLQRQLEASEAWRSGRLTTPRALLWHESTDTWWQQGLPGVQLLDADRALAAAAMTSLGSQLAELHRCTIETGRAVTPDGLRSRLTEVVNVLAPVLGSAAVHRAADALERGFRHLDREATVTLHGDFHARNILVDGTPSQARVALIDLDGVRRGPALIELGAWIADAMFRAMLIGAPIDRDRHAWRKLLDAYAHVSGHRHDEHALRWAVAWSLLTQRAWRGVVNLKPRGWQLAPQLVAMAEVIAAGTGPREHAVP